LCLFLGKFLWLETEGSTIPKPLLLTHANVYFIDFPFPFLYIYNYIEQVACAQDGLRVRFPSLEPLWGIPMQSIRRRR